MTSAEANEVLGIIDRIGPVVLSTTKVTSGEQASALRRMVGLMMADVHMVNMPTFATVLTLCLDLARRCGATLVTMDRVRNAALRETPQTLPATQTVLAIVRLTLASDARILAAMTFRSRDEVEDIALAVNAAFSQTAEVAADDLDAGTYMSIIGLHGAVTQHLAARGRLLPRVIIYSYQMVMPALRMAQRAYANAGRYQELIDENRVVHPLFMPREGQMLAE
jgi:prophage DNA circulation protein